MAGESQASFPASVRTKIRETYQYRCVICLAWTQCAHLLDPATQGKHQLRNAARLGVLHEGFERNAEMNGSVQCPNCRALFTKNHVVLSLPIPVLKYLEKYVSSTRKVFDLLVDALDGTSVDLPNPAAILPYVGLFTLVALDPTAAARHQIGPPNTSATAKNVARIFDSLDIEEGTPINLAIVPLAPGVAAFEEKRYWRFPVFAGVIFAALMPRLLYDESECEDIELANRIVANLMLKRSSGPSGSGGPSGGRGGGLSSRGGGGGSSEGGRRQSKRKIASDEGSPSAEKGKIKARRVAGGDGGPYWNVELPPGVRPQYGQSDRLEIASLTRTLGDDTPAIDTNKDNSDCETGRSISAINPPDTDNPDEWRFGPSFSTNKIVFTVRAVNLT